MKRHTWPLIHLKAVNWKVMVQPLLGVLLFLGLWQWGEPGADQSGHPARTARHRQPALVPRAGASAGAGEGGGLPRAPAGAQCGKAGGGSGGRGEAAPYTGRPTFFDQIATSLLTVLCGFGLATPIAIPCGVLLGMNQGLYRAANPVIQLLKPVSPLAWLPLITLVVSALYASPTPGSPSPSSPRPLTVTLCSLWPTLINTAVGGGGLDRDLHNVSRVLRLSFLTHVRRIVLPGALPMIFTGLRLSLGWPGWC